MSQMDVVVKGVDREGDKHLDVYEVDAGSDLMELKQFLKSRYAKYNVIGATPTKRNLMFTVKIHDEDEMVLPLENIMELVPCMIALDFMSDSSWEPLKMQTFEEYLLDMMGEE